MTLTKPKAVIFDWDNTLVNTWPIIHAALVATFEEMGQEPWSFDQTRNRVRKSMRDSFPEIFGERWQQAGDIYQRHYRKHHLDRLEALPRAEEVLEKVRQLGLYCVVVSNKKGPNLRQEVQHIGWQPWFDHVVGADDARRDKPFVDPVHMAFEKTHIKPSRDVWFIGDSDIDLECAHNTGCTAILFGEHATTHPDYSNSHYLGFAYDAHAHDHSQTLALFERGKQ
jgi:phosphoglycolate phosphatase